MDMNLNYTHCIIKFDVVMASLMYL